MVQLRYPLIVQAVNVLKVRPCLIDGKAVACDEVRKATLASLLRRCSQGVRLNEHLTHPGDIVFLHACKLGCEGIVSKRLGSRYRSGTAATGSSSRTRRRRP